MIAESATAHAKVLRIQDGFESSRKSGWVVLGLRMRILQPVPLMRPIKCSTWVAAIEGGRLVREYEIQADGACLVQATQDFVLFDRAKRRAMLPPKSAREFLRGPNRQHIFDIQISRQSDHFMDLFRHPCTLTSPEFTAPDDAIDDNRHVNNSVYLRWLEHTDQEIRCSGIEIGIEYLNESTAGEEVQIKTLIADGQHHFAFRNSAKVFAVGKYQLQ